VSRTNEKTPKEKELEEILFKNWSQVESETIFSVVLFIAVLGLCSRTKASIF